MPGSCYSEAAYCPRGTHWPGEAEAVEAKTGEVGHDKRRGVGTAGLQFACAEARSVEGGKQETLLNAQRTPATMAQTRCAQTLGVMSN